MKRNNIFIRILDYIFSIFVWYIQLLIPRNKKKWIFGAWFGQKYSDNSRAMYEYVLQNHPEIRALWVTKNHEVYKRLKSEGKPVALDSSFKGVFHALTSRVAFVTVNPREVNGLYLHGAKIVWLWHGMPMKYIEADQQRFEMGDKFDHPSISDKIRKWFHPYMKKRIDCVLSLGDFFIPVFQSSFQVGPEKVWNDGYPRNDKLFSEEQDAIVAEYRKKYPNSRFIIYMPTHRHHALSNKPFSPFECDDFDAKNLFKVLEEEDYVFFYKGHFYDSEVSVQIEHPRFVDVTRSDIDVLYQFVKDMDILITDYSSIYFDYLTLKKPILLTPFDYQDYINNERPLYFDYYTLEAPKANNWKELLDLLRKPISVPSDKEVHKYLNHTDGYSSERVFNHVLDTLL